MQKLRFICTDFIFLLSFLKYISSFKKNRLKKNLADMFLKKNPGLVGETRGVGGA